MFIPFNTEFIVAFPSPHRPGKKSPGSQAVCGSLPRPYGNSPSFLGSFFSLENGGKQEVVSLAGWKIQLLGNQYQYLYILYFILHAYGTMI